MHLNIELNHMLKKFWELENIDEEKHKLTAEEIKVEELYEKTTTRDEDGRYIVELPMRHEAPVLPSNSREIALSRWKSTENRLKSKPQLLEEYNKVLQEYTTLNHMKKKREYHSEEFMKSLDEQEKREEAQTVEIKRKESVKTLGITWEVKTDKLLIPNHIKDIDDNITMTKRSVLSEIASIFDPMGWIAPSVILAKIFMQVLWKKGISWDQELPKELQKEWLQYKRELPALKDISLDRWMHTTKRSTLEL